MTNNYRFRFILYAIILITLITSPGNAFHKIPPAKNPIVIQNGKNEYNLDKHISVLIDKTGKWNIEDISSDSLSKRFIKINTQSPNYEFSNSVYWIRFSVVDSINTAKDMNEYFNDNWLLINKYPSLEDVRLYYRDSLDGNFIEKKAGLISFVKRNTIHNIEFVSQLPVQNDLLKTFYLRISTPSPVIISFRIMSIRSFFHQHSKRLFFFGIMFGIFLLIIIYNSFLYFSIKEKTYLFYVLYIFSCASFLFIYDGYYTNFIGSLFARDYYMLQMAAASSIGLFWLLLTRDFLLTKKYLPSVYKILNLLAVIYAFTIPLLYFLPLNTDIKIFSTATILYFIMGLVISIITLKKGFKLSRFYLLALIGTLIGACVLIGRNYNIFPDNFWTENAFQLGLLWEAIILSYSLGYRMSSLEKRVEERTSELVHRTEELKNLSAHLETVREEERKYVATEIHDEFGGALSLLKMDLFKLQKQNAKQPEIFNPVLQIVDNTIEKVQQISTELRPDILDDLGLVDAIDWYCEEFQKKTSIECSLNIDAAELNIDKNLSLDIFRTLQESLINVVRHANARHIVVNFSHINNKIEMNIVDDGIGISDKQIADTKSIGLIGMRERLHKWNGTFKVFKNDINGTTVYISVLLLNGDSTIPVNQK